MNGHRLALSLPVSACIRSALKRPSAAQRRCGVGAGESAQLMAIEGLGQRHSADRAAHSLRPLLDIIATDCRAHYRQAAALAVLRLTASADALLTCVWSNVFATLGAALRTDQDRYVGAYCYAALLRLALRAKEPLQSQHFLAEAASTLGAEGSCDRYVPASDDEESVVSLLPLSSKDAKTERTLSALRYCPKTNLGSPF